MPDSHLETIRELEHIALVRDTFERHIKLKSSVAVLYDYDAKVKHRIGLPRLRPCQIRFADDRKHPSPRG